MVAPCTAGRNCTFASGLVNYPISHPSSIRARASGLQCSLCGKYPALTRLVARQATGLRGGSKPYALKFNTNC